MENEFETNEQYAYEIQEPKCEFQPITPPTKKKHTGGKVIALALCFSLIGGILGVSGALLTLNYLNAEIPISQEDEKTTILQGDRENSVIQINKIDTSKIMTPAEVYATNVNATVGITTSVTTNYWGQQTTSAASGSGFIFSEDGYILTNYHVIEGSSSITVTLYDGKSYNATVKGYDAGNDMAVLKIDAKDLTPVIIGDSDNLNVGDTVVAIGNPLGELTFSLTQGVISAMNRNVTMASGATMQLLQTDCTINSGNSGGALFNLYGEVIGITNAKYSNNGSYSEATIENIGFAIPVNQILTLVESIIENGYVSKPYIGISVVDVSTQMQNYGLPKGAAVQEVTSGSPAEKGGLQLNDIITEVNDEKISSSNELVALVSKSAPGDTLEMTVYRKGKTVSVKITVGEQLQGSGTQNSSQQNNGSTIQPWGK